MAVPISPPRRRRQRGNNMIEFAFVLVPTFAFFFMTIDLAWMIFIKATLQYAVQCGVRVAAAGRIDNQDLRTRTVTEQTADVIKEVKYRSLGLLNDKESSISIDWYAQVDLSTPLDKTTGTPNDANNIVMVRITDYPASLLLPIMSPGTKAENGNMEGMITRKMYFSAVSADKME